MYQYRNFAKLIVDKRLSLGFQTSKDFHKSLKEPPLSYQSWIHVETGRRLPAPELALKIADSVKIPYQSAILAYLQDLFQKAPVGQKVVEQIINKMK